MKGMRIVAIVAVLVIGLGGAWHYLTAREAIPERSDFVIDLPALRASAQSIPGPLPDHINHQVVAHASMPRAAIFAGESFAPHRMLHGVYQIMYPEGHLLVDSCVGHSSFEEQMGGENSRYDEDAFEIVKRALANAESIVFTHEHFDHMQGLADVDDPVGLADRLVVNRAQIENPETAEFLPAALLDAMDPFDSAGLRAIAPGVVLIAAPGHSPGSQIVYVQLASGSEYLLIGDVAWHMDALRELHYRPRLVTDLFLGEDRAAVMAQFRTLHDLLDTPGLEIVVSHDIDQRRALVRAGKLGDGLEAPARPR